MTLDQPSDHALSQAQNPHTPLEMLYALAQHENPHVRLAVGQNPSARGDTLTVLLDDEYSDIGDAARTHPNLSPALREALEAASDVQTPSVRKEVLAEHPVWRVRRELAQALLTSEELLERLVVDPNVYVRITVAERTGLSPRLAERLSLDPDPQVRNTLLLDDDCSDVVLERLVNDVDERVRSFAQNRLRDRKRSCWTEADAKQALSRGLSGDLDALADVALYRINAALRELPTGSVLFERHFVMPGSEGPDALREALELLISAAVQGQEQAQSILDQFAEDRVYTDPPTRGSLYVDLFYRPDVDELLPSRVDVRLQGSLIEDHAYVDPIRAIAYLHLLGFGWVDPASIADGFDQYNENPELDLESLDVSPFDSQTPLYDFRAGWSVIETLSTQAEQDLDAAVACIGLLDHYSRLGHARSSVVFRTLIQLKAQFERGQP